MGYRPNAYVHALMTQVRLGKKICDQGTIALLVDKRSKNEWFLAEAFGEYHQDIVRRARELGYQVECFFLQEPGMSAAKIDAVLYARGIQGIIFAPPYHGNRALPIHWERYACLGGARPWASQDFDFVCSDHAFNVRLAFKELRQLGYERIGMDLASAFVTGIRKEMRWVPGYLEAQHDLPAANRIPLFTFETDWDDAFCWRAFEKWRSKWRPDVILAIDDKEWFEERGIRIPEDIGFATFDLRPGSSASGVNENFGMVGAVALEQVVAKISRNEYGAPAWPKQTLIEGRWVAGTTTRKQG